MLNEETIRRFIRTIGLESARELINLFLDESRRRVDRMAGHAALLAPSHVARFR